VHSYLIAGQEIQRTGRYAGNSTSCLAERKHVAEQLLGLGGAVEESAPGQARVRRHSPATSKRRREFGREVEELGDVLAACPSKIVALTLTVKPWLGGLEAETARSKTPGCDTAFVVVVFQNRPDARENRYGEGSNRWSFFSNSNALVAEGHEFLAFHQTADDLADSLWISGRRREFATIARTFVRRRPSIPCADIRD